MSEQTDLRQNTDFFFFFLIEERILIRINVLSDPKRKTCTWNKLFIHMQQREEPLKMAGFSYSFSVTLLSVTLFSLLLQLLLNILSLYWCTGDTGMNQALKLLDTVEVQNKNRSPVLGSLVTRYSIIELLHKRLQAMKTSEVNQWHLQTFEFSFPECLIRSWKRAVT